MFNWYSTPTFGAMLLFWMLAAYVLTRSPLNRISLAAVGAQSATAAYLLGQGMQANAPTLEEWLPWARTLQWGATIAPAFWYWLTVLLLREQEVEAARAYLRRFGYPLGLLLVALSVVLTVSIYAVDWLYGWSSATYAPPAQASYSRYHAPVQTLYPGLVVLLAGATLGAAVNVWLCWRWTADQARRSRFAWLFLSALLFIAAANYLGAANWLSLGFGFPWLGHVILAAAMLVMAWNVAAYSLLIQGQVIRTDFLYFLTSIVLVCAAYGLIFLFAGPAYSFRLMGLLAITLTLVILSHSLVNVGRRALDRLFFGSEVQRLRTSLASVVQSAALTQDLDTLLTEAQVEIAEVSTEHFVRLTEEALRRMNNPAALARCGLLSRIPLTLQAAHLRRGTPNSTGATPLEQAQALREALALAIERLKPPDRDQAFSSPAALQFNILREEYLLGNPNKQIMVRHSISEATFHRNRREAILILAQELSKQEELLSREEVDSF